MSRVVNSLLLLLFPPIALHACGRTTFETEGSEAGPDEPWPACDGDEDCNDGDGCAVDGCDDDRGGCTATPGDADRDGYASCDCAPAPCCSAETNTCVY